ncbi:MAG: DUF3048 domain-containing protein [Oscillospiraceae bacterium]|nr:DUF3048 domain-containing protein [Oscillospiraceae bacterium]
MSSRRRPSRKKKSTLGRNIVIILVLLTLVVVFAISACGDTNSNEDTEQPSEIQTPEETPEPTPEPTPTPEPEETPEPTPVPDGAHINPLTGLPVDEDISMNRPIAVMMSNIQVALPMNGITQADIVYEIPVEGGITRMMAFFQEYSDLPTIGSIRSVRHTNVDIAGVHDAMILTSGGSPLALSLINSRGVTYLPEGGRFNSIYFRNNSRISGRTLAGEHSVTTNGELLSSHIPTFDIRTTHEDDFSQPLNFTDNATPVGGSTANEIIVRFGGKSSTFNFNADRNAYYMSQFGNPFVDANNSEQVSFTNIIVIKTSVTALQGPHGGSGRRDIEVVGTGQGFFAHGGQFIPITWSRADEFSPFVYTLSNGSELEVGRGNTYIAIAPLSETIDFN